MDKSLENKIRCVKSIVADMIKDLQSVQGLLSYAAGADDPEVYVIKAIRKVGAVMLGCIDVSDMLGEVAKRSKMARIVKSMEKVMDEQLKKLKG